MFFYVVFFFNVFLFIIIFLFFFYNFCCCIGFVSFFLFFLLFNEILLKTAQRLGAEIFHNINIMIIAGIQFLCYSLIYMKYENKKNVMLCFVYIITLESSQKGSNRDRDKTIFFVILIIGHMLM